MTDRGFGKKLPLRILRAFCDPAILEDVEGDLSELYHQNQHSRYKHLNLLLDVIKLFRPGIIKDFNYTTHNTDMIKNYLISSWRNLMNHKRFSFINIMSLSIGIAACIVIYLFVQDEQQFDGFHTQKDRIYRLCEIQSFTGTNRQKVALTMPGMGPTFLTDFPEVEQFTRYNTYGKQSVTVDGESYLIEQASGVDSTFLTLFDFPLISGDRNGIKGIYDSYITESLAMKIFNSTDVIGKKMDLDGDLVTVRGVLADIPENSHLQFEMIVSIYLGAQGNDDFDNQFGSNYVNTYLIINEGADLKDMESRFPDYLIEKTGDEDITEAYELFLQPLEQVHLGSIDIEHDYNNHRKFNGTYIGVFVLIGIFIMIIAAVNFMNLTTARAGSRAKEVGVRKSIGAHRSQLMYQFILESTLMAMIAFIVALSLDFIALPFLNEAIDRDFSMLSFVSSQAAMFGLLATLGLGVLTGLYPAIYLSSFKPVYVLKGLKLQEGKSIFRSSLIVLQFSMAVGLIVCTMVVIQQLNFMKKKDLGFKTENILLVDLKNQASENYRQIKEELLSKSTVIGVTASGQRLGNNFHQWGFKAKGDTGLIGFAPSNVHVDYDYLDVYGIKIKSGRSFSKDYAKDDGLSFIVNEAFAKQLNNEETVGMSAGHAWYPDDSLGTIIGVAEDFNFNSLHYKINTLSMVVHEGWNYSEMTVKLNGANLQQGITDVQEVYDQFVTDYPFEYSFLDAHFDELYQSDDQLGTVISIVAILAILVGCMGLFGLASISIERRVKEIGIRKVLGASVQDLVLLLSKTFGLLILIAFVVSAPLSWMYLAGWLDGFAYRIDVQILSFVLGGVAALVIAMATISFHVFKAARTNPIQSLRYE